MKYFLLFTCICLASCNSDSVKIDLPDYNPEKYNQLEYEELIEACDKVITKYKDEVEVIDHEIAKTQMISLGIAWYSFYGKTVESKFDSTKTEYFLKRDSAITVLKSYQGKMFPKYRKVFAKYAASLLWEEDCEAAALGNNNEILELSGSYFLPNANKKKAFELLKDIAAKFRFKKMRFKWFSKDYDYFDFDINSEDDKQYVRTID